MLRDRLFAVNLFGVAEECRLGGDPPLQKEKLFNQGC